jgi:MFS family permease
MRGLRSLDYGLLAVLLGVALSGEGFSPVAIGILITVSLVGDMVGTYVIGITADSWGRRRTLAVLALLMAGTGVIFGLTNFYPVLLVTAFFGTLGISASETAPFLPIDQAVIAHITKPERRTALFSHYNLIAAFSVAVGALAAGLAGLLAFLGFPPAFAVHLPFGVSLVWLSVLFFAANLLSALSFLAAVPLARRFGLLSTMVFTHLPSNVLLILVAFAPTGVTIHPCRGAQSCLRSYTLVHLSPGAS